MRSRGRVLRVASVVLGLVVILVGLSLAAPTPATAQVEEVPTDAGFGTPLQTPELLSNGSFAEQTASWSASPGQNLAVYQGSAGEGSSYLETNTGTAGPDGSVWQDVDTAVAQGHSYTGSLLLRSSATVPISVTLVVWALGGGVPTEVGQTDLQVDSTSWTRYATDLDVAEAGHQMLRFQVYVTTTGQNLDLDGASLQDAGLADAGFTQGMGNWQTSAGANRSIYSSSSAPAGQDYLETNSGMTSGSSLYQDMNASPLYDHTYDASVYLRSPSGQPLSVTLVLWALGGPAATDDGATQLTISSTSWTMAYTDVDVDHFGHNLLRFQIYLNTPDLNLDVGGPSVQDGRVVDAGFDQSGLGPWVVSSGANAALESGTAAASGGSWLQTNSNGGSVSSVYQDIDTDIAPGYAYQASLLLRSASAGPIPVTVALWALGGGVTSEVGSSQLTVGSSWGQYSTELDPTVAGHTFLRLQVYVYSSTQTLAIGGAWLPDQTMGPALTGLRQSIVSIAEGQDQYQGSVEATPIGSNCNPYSGYFGRGSTVGANGDSCGPGTLAEEWCSDFADWVWVTAGLDPNVTGWAFDWIYWGEDVGAFKPGPEDDPEAGDAVVWGDMSSQYGQHVGIVVGVADGMINIVSGNSGPETSQGVPYSVWESGYFDPTTSTIDGYPILGYVAPDGFTGS